MTHVNCRLTAKNRDQLQNPTLGNRVWATFTVTLDVDGQLVGGSSSFDPGRKKKSWCLWPQSHATSDANSMTTHSVSVKQSCSTLVLRMLSIFSFASVTASFVPVTLMCGSVQKHPTFLTPVTDINLYVNCTYPRLSDRSQGEPAGTGYTRSSAIAEGPRDASCQLKSCQLPRNSAETTCTTSPEPSISCR